MQTPHTSLRVEIPPDSPPDTTPRPTADATNLDDIRCAVHALAASDRLDKESALQVTRLFHAMEMLHRHAIAERDGDNAALRAEMNQQRLQTELDRLATRQLREDAVAAATPRMSSKFRR